MFSGNRAWENRTFFVSNEDPWTPDAIDALALHGSFWVHDRYLPILSFQCKGRRTIATDVSVVGGYSSVVSLADAPGGDPSPSEAVNVTALTALYDRVDGPKRGGRTLTSGIPRSKVNENDLDPAWCTLLRNAWIAYADLFIGVFHIAQCFVSFRHNGAYRSEGVSYIIDRHVVRPTVYSRRLRSRNSTII